MKCSQCHYVCSNLRDICPKCSRDLRPEKKALGLPISYPQASYEHLVAKQVEGGATPSPTRIVSKFLASIFEPKESSPLTRMKRKTTVVGNLPATREATKTAIPLAEYESRLDDVLESVIVHEEAKYLGGQNKAPVAAPPSPALSLLSNSPESPPLPNLSTEDTSFSLEEEELVFSMPAEIPIAEETLQNSLETEAEQTEPQEIIPPLPFEPLPPLSPLHKKKLHELALFAPIPGDTISHLYWDAAHSLHHYGSNELEFASTQFVRREFDERLKLLYMLAEESIVNPGSLENLQNEFIAASDRKLDAGALEEKLKLVTKLTESTAFSLREGSKISSRPLKPSETATETPLPPLPKKLSAKKIFYALSIDTAVILFLSVLFTVATLKLTHDPAYDALRALELGAYPEVALIYPLSMLAGFFVSLSLLYHFFYSLINGETIGYQQVKSVLVASDGADASVAIRLRRLFYGPFCLLSLSWLWWRVEGASPYKSYSLLDALSLSVATSIESKNRESKQERTAP